MKHATADMFYVIADFLIANSTRNERDDILSGMELCREENNMHNNNKELFYNKKFVKRVLRRIKKML